MLNAYFWGDVSKFKFPWAWLSQLDIYGSHYLWTVPFSVIGTSSMLIEITEVKKKWFGPYILKFSRFRRLIVPYCCSFFTVTLNNHLHFFCCLLFLATLRHMECLGQGSELQLRPKPQLWQCQVPNPLSRAGDWTCVPVAPKTPPILFCPSGSSITFTF